tara:strand:- start:17446 stop:18528 length:1083 start_codon:yes stop_codon:yes gene_type:complete
MNTRHTTDRPRRACRERSRHDSQNSQKHRADAPARPPPTKLPMYDPATIERPERATRVAVMHSTLAYLHSYEKSLQISAARNVARWAGLTAHTSERPARRVLLVSGDMLETACKLTKEYGRVFAVLNMANAVHPGGGFATGSAAQEENMMRRTNIVPKLNDPSKLRWDEHGNVPIYTKEMTDLLNAKHGVVGCDDPGETISPRQMHIVIRGREVFEDDDLGYRFLTEGEVFPFYELRAAAVNLNRYKPASLGETQLECIHNEMYHRVNAQLWTLVQRGIRHVVLSAFGCGAFGNDPTKIATIYAELLKQPPYVDAFDVVAFSIFFAGFGANNAFVFQEAFKQSSLSFESYSGGYPSSSVV